ncbi:Dihydroorotate dehydrogenase (NAD(+)), electron transfer subunit [hydrothermal vent metagenome]|uniref:Dihydroorotate dehydrogenase (NAD(+)), electron transfer subunit n=1 Tax=hydrothermal vent metagenome TaxID=652676 RepID=A0A3B0YFE7_9ZZZZ
MKSSQSHRNTIFSEQAKVLSHHAYDGDQYILRVHAPECASHAQAGSFSHIQCHPLRAMRRPLSIMRVSATQGWVDFLYKAVGEGTKLLSQAQVGEELSLLGPIGQGFTLSSQRPLRVLIGGGVGIPPMVFLAEQIKQQKQQAQSFTIMGSEVPFPFNTQPSQIIVSGIPADVTACMPLLDDWGIASRLCSTQDYAGCYQGYVTGLARHYIESIEQSQHSNIEIFSCGPEPMLKAVAELAREFNIACQISLEEYMACAVGGCAGCVVEVNTDQGPTMKRVCVDGPVFDAKLIY